MTVVMVVYKYRNENEMHKSPFIIIVVIFINYSSIGAVQG